MNRFLYTIVLSLTAFLCVLTASAQKTGFPITISGTVVGNGKQPLAGVSILIQEKLSTAATDNLGKFSLTCTSTDVIIFRNSGYNNLSIAASEIVGGEIIMVQSLIESGDDDNVFIPFGVRKKRVVSASVSTVKGSELPQLPLSTLNNVFSGRIPGLYVKQTGSRPGTDDADFLIRGRSSYNSNQEPLVLVDGVARDFVNMDLNEIESISVLKDAASLSWYGMSAANGVIYVTTKRGNASSTKVTLDVQGGVQTPVDIAKPLSSYNYALMYNQALANSGAAPLYNQAALDAYQNRSDLLTYPDNNFSDQFLKPASPVQRYVATVSGGNSFVKYFTLLSFYNQAGLYNEANNPKYNSNANYQRYNFRTNLDMHLNKNLDVTIDVGGRVESIRYPSSGTGTFLSTILTTPANAFPLINADGTYGGTSQFRNNPLAMLNANGNFTDLYRTLLATLNVRQKLDNVLKGLSASVFYTYDITGLYQSGYEQQYEVYALNAGTYTRFGNKTPLTYKPSVFSGSLRNNEFWGGFDYDRTFKNHQINFSTRFQQTVSAAPGRLDNRKQGVSNRLSYNFKQRYLVDVIGTYSGSQNFAPGKRYGFFPAVSAGWIASDEKFFKGIKAIDYLKLRGSVGIVGNDGVSARRFAYKDYYSRGGTQYFFGTGYNNVPNTDFVDLANPDLTWEKALKSSIGFDAKLFKQSLSVSFDAFAERRTNLLTTALLPNILGQASVPVNDGEAKLKGYEIGVTYNKSFGKFRVDVFGNYTHQESKIVALNQVAGLPPYQSQIGVAIGSVIQGASFIKNFLTAEGIFQTQAEIEASPVQRFSGITKPGDIKYKDINGDRVIDNLDFITTEYSDVPTDYFGFGTGLYYKNIDLNVTFMGVKGRTIQINDLINSGSANNGYINQFSPDSWTPQKGTSAIYPRMTLTDRGNNTQNSTFWLRSGDFVRLKSVEIGYSFSDKLLKKIHINKCRFYVSGYNLLTFSKIKDLPIDPEIPTAGHNASYPYLRTFTGGMTLNF
ncbi:MAG: TonB-dependent receptor [Bacteroidota bacterium]